MFRRRVSFHILAAAVFAMVSWTGCTPDSSETSGEEATGPTEAPAATAADAPDAPASPSAEGIAEAEAARDVFAECIAEAETRMGDAACMDAATTLARYGGPPLETTLKQLEDTNVSPHGKVMVVEGFKGKLPEGTYSLLTSMTALDKDEMTRLCATALLASISDVNLVPSLIQLADDPDPKLSFTALLGLAPGASEGSEFRQRLKDRYGAADVTPSMREHIVVAIGQNPYAEDEPLLIDALQDTELNADVRAGAATALGRIGGNPAVEALVATDVADTPSALGDAVELAIAAIKERLSASDENAVTVDLMDMPDEK